MGQSSLEEDIAYTLHGNAIIKSRVGDRVRTDKSIVELPDIVVSATASDNRNTQVTLTCRAATANEADRVGAAVITALEPQHPHSRARTWITIQDRSGYDASVKAFRRIISLEPKP